VAVCIKAGLLVNGRIESESFFEILSFANGNLGI
jgi:hypothetical protein